MGTLKRERLIFCAALLTAALAALAAGLTAHEMGIQTRGYEDATRTADLPYRVPIVGVTGNWLDISQERLQDELVRLRGANATWFRQAISWSLIETERGHYNWEKTDLLTDSVQKTPGARLVAWLLDRPSWISDDEYPAAFARFAADFAARYGDFIDHYQLGEANQAVEDYAAMLAAAHPVIHEADADATVLTAPLRSPHELAYLEELYALGANRYWDAISIAHSAYVTPPSDRRVDTTVVNFSRLILLRELMREKGDGKQAIWLTDFAWQVPPANEHKSHYLQALRRVQREWPWLGVVFLPDSALQEQELLQELHNLKTRAPQNGLFPMHPMLNEAIRYSGEWSFAGDAADYSRSVNSELSFTFRGRDIALLLREDAWHTVLYAGVDGKAPNALPKVQEERGYLILTSADRSPRLGLTTLARNLSLADHKLQLIGGGGDNHFALMGIGISSGNLAEPYARQLALAIISMSLSAVFACLSALPLVKPLGKRIQSYRASLQQETFPSDKEYSITHHAAAVSYVFAITFYFIMQAQVALPSTILFGAALCVLILWRREIGLALTLMVLPFHRLPILLWGFQFPPAELLLLLTLTAEMIVRLLRWKQTLTLLFTQRLRVLDILTLLWVTLGAITLFWARWPEPALTDWRTLFLEPAIFYSLLRVHARVSTTQQRLIAAVLFGAFMTSALGIYQFLSGTSFVTAEAGVRRLVSVYGSPNHAALFWGRCIPYVTVLWLYARSTGIRYLTAGVTILLLVAVILTQSFAALMLGLPAGILVVTLAKRHRVRRYLAGGVAILILLAILLGGRLNAWWNWQEGSLYLRTNIWQSAMQMLADEPIRGFGLDQFLYAYRDIYIAPDAWRDPDISHPHNFVLDIWLRLGAFGVVLFVMFQWFFWQRIISTIRSRKDNSRWVFMLSLATAGSMVSLIAHGLVDSSIFLQDLAFLFALQIAFAQIPSFETAAKT